MKSSLTLLLLCSSAFGQTSSVGSHALNNGFSELFTVAPICRHVADLSTTVGPGKLDDDGLKALDECRKQARAAAQKLADSGKEITAKTVHLKTGGGKMETKLLIMLSAKQALIINLEMDLLITSMKYDLCTVK